jgi:hypothetical protein
MKASDYDAAEARIREQDARIAELESLLREISPGLRDILWCALVWNDHNFTERTLLDKATRAAKSMGLDRFNGVDAVNVWMARVDKALGSTNSGGSEHE